MSLAVTWRCIFCHAHATNSPAGYYYAKYERRAICLAWNSIVICNIICDAKLRCILHCGTTIGDYNTPLLRVLISSHSTNQLLQHLFPTASDRQLSFVPQLTMRLLVGYGTDFILHLNVVCKRSQKRNIIEAEIVFFGSNFRIASFWVIDSRSIHSI